MINRVAWLGAWGLSGPTPHSGSAFHPHSARTVPTSIVTHFYISQKISTEQGDQGFVKSSDWVLNQARLRIGGIISPCLPRTSYTDPRLGRSPCLAIRTSVWGYSSQLKLSGSFYILVSRIVSVKRSLILLCLAQWLVSLLLRFCASQSTPVLDILIAPWIKGNHFSHLSVLLLR